MNIRRWQIVAACVFAAAAAFIIGTVMRQNTPAAKPPTSGAVSEQALSGLFAIQLDDFRGRPHAFAQWKGQILVVNFWATWCAPCREEMPYFSRIAEKHAANGVQFVGISTDPAETVGAFAERYQISYPLLIGGPGAIELSAALGNGLKGLPYTIILGRNGEPLLTRTGRLPEAELEALLERLN
jgi:thiol-disulfide isomerase/thioredoxin